MTEETFCEIVERSRRSMRTPDGSSSCLICGRGPLGHKDFLGVFIADEPTQNRIGAPSGKCRRVLYLICAECWENPDMADLVEEKIIKELTIQ